MVKNTKKKSKRVTGKMRVMRASTRALDQQALAYARLLADPCGAPLVHPVYPGGDSGFLFRAESFRTYGNTAGNTAGVIHWVPGYYNGSNTHIVGGAGADGATSFAATAIGGDAPGNGFLTGNCRGARCVAACMKISFAGSESARSGRIHYGHTTAGLIDATETIVPDTVAQTLQHYSRTPAETIEVIWRPGVADTIMTDPTATATASIRDQKSAITVAYAGLPAGVGIIIHYTAIFEWMPVYGLGVGHNAMGKNTSANTFDDVLDSLIRSGFTFVRQAGAHVGAGLAAGLVSGISNTFGLMPSLPTSRQRVTYRN